MAKQWKKNVYKFRDIGGRDAPCVLYDNKLYIGTENISHAMLVQQAIYGMDFDNIGEAVQNAWQYEKLISDGKDKMDNEVQKVQEKTEGLLFYRSSIKEELKDEVYIFGEVITVNDIKEIYWDLDCINNQYKNDIMLMLKYMSESKEGRGYKHYLCKEDKAIPLKFK